MNKINSWYSLPFSKYIDIVTCEQTDDELNNLIHLVAIVNDLEVNEVEKMTTKEFSKYSSNLAFMANEPNIKEAKLKWKIKDLHKITMDDFISFENQKYETLNIPLILAFMSDREENEILEMSTIEVLNGFFLLKKSLKKFINYSAFSLAKKVMMNKLKVLVPWGKK